MVREHRESAVVLEVTDDTPTPGLTLDLMSMLSCSHPSARGTEELQVARICIKTLEEMGYEVTAFLHCQVLTRTDKIYQCVFFGLRPSLCNWSSHRLLMGGWSQLSGSSSVPLGS